MEASTVSRPSTGPTAPSAASTRPAQPPSSTTSTSRPGWTWQPTYGLFHDAARDVWARYDSASGAYFFLSDPSSSPTASPSRSSRTRSPNSALEDGELQPTAGDRAVAALGSATARPAPSTYSLSLSNSSVQPYDDPSIYAFPSDGLDPVPADPLGPQSFLRLVVLESACLPPTQRVAVLSSLQQDGYSIARDKLSTGSSEGRIRLRELAVSKHHATIWFSPPSSESELPSHLYVDRDADASPGDVSGGWVGEAARTDGRWFIVDVGSTQGTWLAVATLAVSEKGQRLSESKRASLPRRLEHGMRISIGSTCFQVHLHETTPCEACSLTASSTSIPTCLVLAPPPQASPTFTAGSRPAQPPVDAKTRLKRLKDDLVRSSSTSLAPPLKRLREDTTLAEVSSSSSSAPVAALYRDRAGLRRAAHPSFASAPPSTSSSQREIVTRAPAHARAPPPEPLDSSNIGHALLSKYGWTEGTGLGRAEAQGAVEPVSAGRSAAEGTRGIGARTSAIANQQASGSEDWRAAGKERRWRELG